MKRKRKKLTAYALVAVLSLSFAVYPVYAEEETPQQTQDMVGSEEKTLSDVKTQPEEKALLGTTNNAGDFNVTGGTSGTEWTYDGRADTLTFNTSGTYTIEGNGQETAEQIQVAHGFEGTITIKNVNAKTMNVENTAKLTLYLDGTNTLREGLRFADATTGTLTIDSLTNGSLSATGGNNGAGIGGGGIWRAGNNITINGGTVIATSGYGGAGIGGGYSGVGSNITINGGAVTVTGKSGAGIGGGSVEAGHSITINGGTVTATSIDGAGIGGGGTGGEGNNITINGGTVTAISNNGAGIGGGWLKTGNNITINGGTVTAISNDGAGIGGGYQGGASNIIIDGGSVKASWIGTVPTNNNGNPVYLAKLENQSGVNEATVDDKSFTRQGDHPDDGAFYLYLTGQDHTITTPLGKYKAIWNETDGFDILPYAVTPTIILDKTTANSITVKVLENQDIYGTAEYSLDNQNWQSSNEFTGLNAYTEYTIYARYQGNDMYACSEAGTATVATMKDGNTLLEEKIPANLKGVYEQKLSDVTLADGWTWVDKDTALSVGSQNYPARFDTTGYEKEYDFQNVSGYDSTNHYVETSLSVNVSKADTALAFKTENLDKSYDGQAVSEPEVEKTGSSHKVIFAWYQKDKNDWKELASAPADTGTYKVVASVEADDNYNGASAELEFVISQTENEWTEELSVTDWTYGDKANTPTATSKYGTVTFTYSDTKDGTYTDTIPANAGTWYVKATVAGNENYTGLEAVKSFTINKAVPVYQVPDKLTIRQGQAISTVKLPEHFAWADGTQKADELGSHIFKAVYTPADTANYQSVEVEIPVNVVPALTPLNHIPIITAKDITLTVGDTFDTMAGVTASDKEDGDITDKIEVFKNTVDTSKAGIYTVTYKVTDKDGASVTKTITVKVKDKEKQPAIPTTPDKPDTAVKTGDSTNILLWNMVAVISLAGVLTALFFKRRRSR